MEDGVDFQWRNESCVESTNNRGERALRPSVIYRNDSCGTRSKRCAGIYMMLCSKCYTPKMRGKNFTIDTPSVSEEGLKEGDRISTLD